MQLIGMPDSPFVRRVAITMQLLGIPCEARAISVFRTYDQFRAINPVVKAPTLVCDDGEQIMDSTLIIDYLEHASGKSLMPAGLKERQRALKLIGIALAACEKTFQMAVELSVRKNTTHDDAWQVRVMEQLNAALSLLESHLGAQPFSATLDQAAITVAVTWNFTQSYLKETIRASDFPALAAHAAWAETQPAFQAVPVA